MFLLRFNLIYHLLDLLLGKSKIKTGDIPHEYLVLYGAKLLVLIHQILLLCLLLLNTLCIFLFLNNWPLAKILKRLVGVQLSLHCELLVLGLWLRPHYLVLFRYFLHQGLFILEGIISERGKFVLSKGSHGLVDLVFYQIVLIVKPALEDGVDRKVDHGSSSQSYFWVERALGLALVRNKSPNVKLLLLLNYSINSSSPNMLAHEVEFMAIPFLHEWFPLILGQVFAAFDDQVPVIP